MSKQQIVTKKKTAKVAVKKRSANINTKGQFVNGNKPTGGRKSGTPNKLSAELKGGIMKAYHEQGGVEYLNMLAEKKPELFVGLLKALIPAEIKASLEGKSNITYVVHTGASNRPPIGVNNSNSTLIRND